MSDQTKLNLAALLILLVAAVFIVAEFVLFRIARRVRNQPIGGVKGVSTGSRVMTYALMIVLSLLSFPAATFSLVESFVAPWQMLWPSAGLFLVSGVAGLVAAAWLMTKPARRMVAVSIAGMLALILAILACSIFLVPLR